MSVVNRRAEASADDVRHFYELLQILGPFVGPRTHGSLRTSNFDELSYSPLRRFLDKLSWVCDYIPGGDTVSALALQDSMNSPKFWLAAPFKYAKPIRIHLTEVIELLKTANGLSARDCHNLELELCNKCIDFASKRVKRYTRLLLCFFGKCQEDLSCSDEQLAQDLSHLTSLERSPIELCSKADQFRDSESLKLLSRHVSSVAAPSKWSMLRHYIGRLGSWHRASRTLVSYASMRPEIFADVQPMVLETPRPIIVPPADESTNLSSFLSRLFTQQEQRELKRGIEILQRLRRLDLDSEFRKKYGDKNFKPRVHAEVLLLEQFHRDDMRFLDSDQYVGCSKPSCYCCNIYMLNRQSEPMQPHSHGNVWTNWMSPLHHHDCSQSLNTSIRSAMILKFKEDLKTQVTGPATNYGRIPDTTTGLSVPDIL